MNERQRAILDGLTRLFGAGVGSFYQDGVRLADDPSFLARTNYIGLSMREIQGSVFEALGLLPDEIGAFDRDSGQAQSDQAGHSRNDHIRQIAKLLNIPESEPSIQWWLKVSLHRLTHRDGLHAPRQLDSGDWLAFETLLELVIDRYELVYKRGVVDRRLDELLRRGPGHPDAARILGRLPQSHRPVAQAYFCRHAGPEWVTHLPAAWLDNPPRLEPVPDQPGSLWHPTWPVSAFFARVAPSSPDEVHKQVMRIIDVATPNHWVHRDLALAELHVSGAKMAAWARRESHWLSGQSWIGFLLRSPLADCVRSLVDKKEPDAAFELARVLFRFDAPITADREGAPDQIDAYDFITCIRQAAQALASARPVETVEWLGELVARQFATTDRRITHALVPSVAGDEVALFKVDDLVRVLRDIADSAIAGNPDLAGQVVAALQSQPDDSGVIDRVRLHLLGRHGEQVRAEAIAAISDPATFAPGLMPEASALLRSAVPTLSPEERSAALDAITGGTLVDGTKDRLRELVITSSAGTLDDEIAELTRRFTVHDVAQDAPVPQATLAAWPSRNSRRI